jgi:hypothetical protein
MTQGVLIYAFNNELIDYISIAKEAARRVKLFLNKPVALITDSSEWVSTIDPDGKIFDIVIDIWSDTTLRQFFSELSIKNIRRYSDGSLTQRKLTFKNAIRTKTYELTPFDETLVIDCDYFIANSHLNFCWEQPQNFLIYKEGQDLAGFRDTFEFQRISDYTTDFYWATVFFFKKSAETKVFFGLVDHVKDNWEYYKLTYQFSSKLYRNDHAFSIAIHIMNGYTNTDWAGALPGRLLYTADTDLLVKMTDSDFTVLLEKENYQGSYTLQKTSGLSIHIMNKFSISRVTEGGSI